VCARKQKGTQADRRLNYEPQQEKEEASQKAAYQAVDHKEWPIRSDAKGNCETCG
jgi:hypothetical protein